MKQILQILAVAAVFLSLSACKGAPQTDSAVASTAASDIRTLAQTDYPAAMQRIGKALRSGEISVFQANNLRANITYLYTEDYSSAAAYMLKTLEQEEAKDPQERTGLLYHLATIYEGGKDYQALLSTCEEGKKTARQAGMPFEEKSFDFLAGSVLFEMGEDETGLSLMQEAAQEALGIATEESEFGHVQYFTQRLISCYIAIDNYSKALEQCARQEILLGRMQKKFPQVDPEYIDRCIFYLSADRAICHASLGNKIEAEEYFGKALECDFASTQGGFARQVDYYAAIGDPRRVLEIYEEKIPFPDTDTLSRAWRLRLSRILKAYHNASIQEKENEYQARYNALSVLIEEKERAEETKAKAAQYDASRSRARLSDTIGSLKKTHRTTNLLLILFIAALAGFVILNRFFSRRADRQHDQQSEVLQKELESIRRQVSIITEKDSQKGAPRRKAPITKVIEDNKLYLNKDLTRAAVASMLGVQEQEIPKMLDAVKPGLGFPEYINSLRIRYALELMALNPDITVVDLADRSGFYTKRTFQRAFHNITGKTPSEYAQDLKLNK